MFGALNSPTKKVAYAMRRSSSFARRCGERLRNYGQEKKLKAAKKLKVRRNSSQREVLDEISRQKHTTNNGAGIGRWYAWLKLAVIVVVGLATYGANIEVSEGVRNSLDAFLMVMGTAIIFAVLFGLVAAVYFMFIRSSLESRHVNYAATLMPKIKKGTRIKKKKLARKVDLPIQKAGA